MNKLCLAILDGFGIVEKTKKTNKVTLGSLICGQKQKEPDVFIEQKNKENAVDYCSDKKFKQLFKDNPYCLLEASGEAVGLPKGQMGNSEVGHQNIGAGKVVLQDLMRINKSFKDGDILNNKNFAKFINSKKVKHIIGLTSNGNVHSSIEHLFCILDELKKAGQKAYIHVITDGRDTGVNDGEKFVKKLEQKCKKDGHIIASIAGRYYAMDREGNLDRTKLYFDAIYSGECVTEQKVLDYVKNSYNSDVTDEFIKPVLFNKNYAINNGDDVLIFNFRADRVRQITEMFLNKTKCTVFTMTNYKKEFTKAKVIFEPDYVTNTLSEILAKNKLTQLKVAEFSKYAHVTYFLNGRREDAFKLEDRVMLPMANVATFDKKPEMSADGVTKEVASGMERGYDFICVNYANCDMVGHTGNLQATQKAVQCVTQKIVELYNNAKKYGYILVVTADHGNAEQMVQNNNLCTTHTTNRVPFLVLNAGDINLKQNGALCNIAPTILDLMQIKQK